MIGWMDSMRNTCARFSGEKIISWIVDYACRMPSPNSFFLVVNVTYGFFSIAAL